MPLSVSMEKFFAKEKYTREDIEKFSSTPEELESAKLLPEVSYEVSKPTKQRRREIIHNIFSAILFPYGLLRLIARIARIVAGFFVSGPTKKKNKLNHYRKKYGERLKKEDFLVKRLTLKIGGEKYDGILIAHRDTLASKKWDIRCLGRTRSYERTMKKEISVFPTRKRNILMVNRPSVGCSEGYPLPEEMGNSQRVGIRLLEEIGSQKIAIDMHSLGGATGGEAILQHDFKGKTKKDKPTYVAIFDRTFGTLSQTVSAMTNPILGFLLRLINYNFSVIKASKRLEEHNIQQIIIQATNPTKYLNKEKRILNPQTSVFSSDGTIPERATLAGALKKENLNLLENRIFMAAKKKMPHSENKNPEFDKILYAKVDRLLKPQRTPDFFCL
ncbi:MAG: hypothetical protein K940chlam7_00110 [Chlamydiae bacterium]|nr:hypothetical protein [Chlamydiota bacterium]